MNAKKPPKDLSPLLRPDIKHDIISIGSEECLKTIFKSAFSASKLKWVDAIRKCLGPEYQIVSSHSLMGIHLVVLAHIRLIPIIKNVQSNHVATGLFNSIGNKGKENDYIKQIGGVGVSFFVGETSIIFINCHLASGEEEHKDERRTRDFANIDRKLKLPFRYNVTEHKTKDNLDLTRVSNRFDCCIWSGDFNYRLKGNAKSIFTMIKTNQFEILKENESLTLRLKADSLPKDFTEGEIEFAPTYKIKNNTDEYNNKKRIPAWCDRIIFK